MQLQTLWFYSFSFINSLKISSVTEISFNAEINDFNNFIVMKNI